MAPNNGRDEFVDFRRCLEVQSLSLRQLESEGSGFPLIVESNPDQPRDCFDVLRSVSLDPTRSPIAVTRAGRGNPGINGGN